ncbi:MULTISPECIES: HesA/MoeB/ThiF family protein [unclassified Pseudoalteromonas]|uniref:HesA/MoeB/ThiF family protein n=1 Tax=unclassified Pseudoalteromonas TaxID=194690 RepID=UPI002279DBE9|nr:HesA/MoeB/ThiF family protein [Pseudoalteromonas sp. T1lg48]
MSVEELSAKEQIRYSRQLMLDGFGMDAQLRLKNATLLVVGCGGLGSPALMYLASSGIGRLRLMDDDLVELSNLQRQVLFKVNHLGQPKAKAAAKVLASLNNEIAVEAIVTRADANNLDELVNDSDLVLDCSDNFATRYAVNRSCYAQKKPLVSAAASGFNAHLAYFDFRRAASPCYECVFPEREDNPSDNCATQGVIAPLLGIIGAQQALLAIQCILGTGETGVVHSYNAHTLGQKQFKLPKDPDCDCCGK